MLASLGGEPVELGFAIVLRESPFTFHQAFVFQTPQGRVERPFFHQQRFVALAQDEIGYRVTVQPAPGQGLENENV